ncbi:MAG: efflux RND transporter periplasmic adaptor subunit [Beijerinckiaceae bacterium]|nr:efflux RND transporter periplasmic adaptor subunit [Beijerinckiaceae bacterium]
MKPVLRYGLAVVALGAIAALGVFFVSHRPVNVEVAAIEENVPIRVFGLGSVEARVLSRIGFEAGATLSELNADHGERVVKGQVLARLDPGEQSAKVAKARAALSIAEVGIARSAANQEKSVAVLAQRELVATRRLALIGREAVTQQALEEAQRDAAVARADVTIAGVEIETAKAQLTDARAQLQFEETMLRHRTLAAPFDAIVIERHKELGSVVKAGDPIFTLVEAGSFWGLAFVDEARAGYIAEGQMVEARMRSRPQESFTGQVVRIGLESDRTTEERKVFIKGNSPPTQVFLGEQVEFRIAVATLPRALMVPEIAVSGFDGREGTVWTIEDGTLQRRLIRTRHRSDDARLEIVGGLPDGALVVSRIDPALREGRAARVAMPASVGKRP